MILTLFIAKEKYFPYPQKMKNERRFNQTN